jgi:hypothetical protein
MSVNTYSHLLTVITVYLCYSHEYPEKTTDMPQVNVKLYHIITIVPSTAGYERESNSAAAFCCSKV